MSIHVSIISCFYFYFIEHNYEFKLCCYGKILLLLESVYIVPVRNYVFPERCTSGARARCHGNCYVTFQQEGNNRDRSAAVSRQAKVIPPTSRTTWHKRRCRQRLSRKGWHRSQSAICSRIDTIFDPVAAYATTMANQAGWQVNKTVIECNRYMLRNRICADVILEVNQPDVKTTHFYGHRYVLASRSPVFHALFNNEKLHKKEDIAITKITDVKPEAFEALLKYASTHAHVGVSAYCKIYESLSSLLRGRTQWSGSHFSHM